MMEQYLTGNSVDSMGGQLDLVSIRLKKDRTLYSNKPIHNPDQAVQLLGEMLGEFNREVVAFLNMNTKGMVINASVVAFGQIDTCPVCIGEIMKLALLSNASSILLMHNHPSGDCSPSQEDLKVTSRVAKAARLVDISLLDHIIVTPDASAKCSILEKYPQYFEVKGESFCAEPHYYKGRSR